ncbi:acyltransferase family protein [Enterobacter pasteurii]|uniref:acyltransferase family protein n=1 Tax=Enterobacter pasteurii TaxID=3029761 RepID=UPI003989A215
MLASSVTKKAGYRPDIDGIRAVAVIAVILYHFQISSFKGGFVGVDIFFAISGYLISKGIISNVDKNKFSFSDFYSRRTRRLIPALLSVIGLTYFSAYFIQSPNDFSQMSGSVVYALAGISNIYFWKISGYFDNFASLKPLLHTWSLSVELQFYIIWPVVLMLICKLTKKDIARLLIIGTITIALAAISISHVNKDSSGAFYLTHYRMHEFTIGAMFVLIERYLKNTVSATFVYSLGMVMVFVSIFTFDVHSIVFPGFYALIPCIGTAMMIGSGEHSRISFLLGSKVPRFIGEISYSLYLVHWPVYVMNSYVLVFPMDNMQIVISLIATLLLSLMLYFAIEKPLRTPGAVVKSGPAFSLACSLFAIAIIIPSASSWAEKGWEWRIPKELQDINHIETADTTGYTWKAQEKLAAKNEFQNFSKKKILVIGDSQSADVINMMSESGVLENNDVIARTIYFDCGTPFVSKQDMDDYFYKKNPKTIARPELIPKCQNQIEGIINGNLIKEADEIYVAFYYLPNLESYVIKGIDKVKAASKGNVIVFGRKGFSKSSIDIANSFSRIVGLEKYGAKFIDPLTPKINSELKNYAGKNFVDVLSYICKDDEDCSVLTDDLKPIYYDNAHFTKYGAKYIGNKIFGSH